MLAAEQSLRWLNIYKTGGKKEKQLLLLAAVHAACTFNFAAHIPL